MENNKTAETRDVLIKDVNRLKDNAFQIAQDVRDHAAAHVDDTKSKVRGALASVRENMVAHPMSLVGAGFAAGLLLGMRFRR